jgi:cardiolipin synthase
MGLIVRDNEYLGIAIALVSQAKENINISTFKVERTDKPKGRNIEELYKAIIEKIKQGVKVNLLFNWHDDKKSIAKTNLGAGQFLKNYGVKVKHLKNNRCCHAKILTVDSQKALLGSHNWSIRSFESNFELSYLIDEPETVKQIDSIFQRSWSDGKDF